jgi:exopolysaccharide biosynthesis polyprenyl glycosylphosphotransferase
MALQSREVVDLGISAPRPSKDRVRRDAKRWLFLLVTTCGAAAIGALGIGLGYWAFNGSPNCVAQGCRDTSYYSALAIANGCFLAILFLWSRPDSKRTGLGYLEEAVAAVRQASIAAVASVLFAFFWRPGRIPHRFAYSRGALVVAWLVTMVLLAAFRMLVKAALNFLRKRGHNVVNVALVGDSPSAGTFKNALDLHPEIGYRLSAHLHESLEGDELRHALSGLAERGPLSEVVLAQHSLSTKSLKHVKVRALPELFGLPPAKVQVTPMVGEFPLLSLLGDPAPGVTRHVKRGIDIVGAILAMIVTAPLFALAAIGVRLSSPGPILFRQERIGMDGRLFSVIKFRTMYHEADSELHEAYVTAMLSGNGVDTVEGLYKLGEDPRVTGFGRFLRRFSIDELPQLLNVLKGDMSLVGPRPALAYEVELYEDWQRRRLDFRPGITGLWQVSGRSRLSLQDMLRLDVRYVETWTPLRDVIIILQTLPALFRSEAR